MLLATPNHFVRFVSRQSTKTDLRSLSLNSKCWF